MVNLKDLDSKFVNVNSDIAELQTAIKDMQTAQNANVVMPVEYDPEIKRRIILQNPYTEWLRQEGRIKPTNRVKIGYKIKKGNTKSVFINEDDDIPNATPADFDKRIAYMKILQYSLSIGDLAQKGADFDLTADELNDGYIDIANTLDIALLEGKGTDEDKDFKGIFNTIKTNTIKLGGDLLTKDDLTSLFQGIIEEGGYPTGLVCTSEIGDQINDIYYPGTVKELTLDMVGGYTVSAIKTTAGNIMPIIIDRHIDNSQGEKLAVIDSSTINVKELMPPTIVPFAKTKLALTESIVQFITAYCDCEEKNGMITGIGKDTDRPSLIRTGDVSLSVVGTDGKPVGGAKVQFTNSYGDAFKSGSTNNRGLAEIPQLVYGNYGISFDTVPSGYSALSSYADFEIKANESAIQLVLTKN